ncbi:MAG: DEAD/DEAH box helicase [Planctomycetota bacterium]
MGIVTPTPIQKLAIGPVLEGRDVIAKAETGTGKTLAFGAPMMAKIDPARASVLALALCPTRELAEQVAKVLAELGKARGIKVALIVGGEPSGPQVAALKAGSQVVVGTPGRVLDLYQQKFLSFPWTEFVILDEADVMLEIGFIDDVKRILSLTPDERQTLLFSATFPPELLKLAREYTRNPAEVATASGVTTVDTIEQSWMQVDEEDRPLALIRLIEQSEQDDVFLVFCDRRTDVDRLMRRLERMPFTVKALHGGYEQDARFRVMSAFRTGEVKALVATDVASRGLDVVHVTHVVNYGVPHDITDYTHRIGRTGRAGRKGRAITIVSRTNAHKWTRIARDARWPIPEMPPPGSRSERRDRSESTPRRASGERTERNERPKQPRADTGRAGERAPARHAASRHGPSRHGPTRAEERAPARDARAPAEPERTPRTPREPRAPVVRREPHAKREAAPRAPDARREPRREAPPPSSAAMSAARFERPEHPRPASARGETSRPARTERSSERPQRGEHARSHAPASKRPRGGDTARRSGGDRGHAPRTARAVPQDDAPRARRPMPHGEHEHKAASHGDAARQAPARSDHGRREAAPRDTHARERQATRRPHGDSDHGNADKRR